MKPVSWSEVIMGKKKANYKTCIKHLKEAAVDFFSKTGL